jgi:thiol-disulfide isomerase/thioredoxin
MAAVMALALTATAARAADELNVGDPAPKLEVKDFVKGDPVKGLEPGKVYVVEFWATWCGPCRATIPHLTELQKKHKDVTFIGVSAFEQDFGKVKPFVEEMGEKMEYRVAMDAVPAGKPAAEGAMAKHWMDAAGQNGIPTAFIVNADGKVAWIGHPVELEQPLADVVAGKWDLTAAATKFKEKMAAQRKMQAIIAKVREAQRARDPKAIVAAIEGAIQEDATLEARLAPMKFSALCESGAIDAAVDYGRKLIGDVYKNDAGALNELSWGVVDPDKVQTKKPDPKLLRVALDAAEKANDLARGKDPNVVDTLAQAHFVSGNLAKAVELQEQAVKMAPDNAEMKQRLETFKKALDKK